MKNKYLQQLIYFVYWLVFFVICRGLFLLYHHLKTATLSLTEVLNTFIYGLKLDASCAAYICILPFFFFFLQCFIKRISFKRVVDYYTIILITFISFLTIADLELYKAWGFRLDDTPLQYFNSPKEMRASISSSPIFLLIIFFLLLSTFSIWLYKKFFTNFIYAKPDKLKVLPVIFSICCFLFLIIPIRGGFQQIPIGQSAAYFSDNMFANHAAVNVPWNFAHSLLNKNMNQKNPYQYFDDANAKKYIDSLYSSSATEPPSILTTQKPNIIFIILESYTSKFIGCLGGERGVTPNIDSIAKGGMLFTNIYASGYRSEKGLVALLSGYPAEPATSIILTPSKTQHLPHLNLVLKSLGYHSSYYYGGELGFANIKSYLLNAGYERIIGKDDFNSKDYNSKWGVHDHVLLNRFLTDLNSEKQPFFSTLFTLSSHEPYDIPIAQKFPGNDETSKFKNSFHYTDEAIGDFIRVAQTKPWWQNTLVIMIADHGHRLPGEDPADSSSKYKIPLILTGGALKNRNQINTCIGSQTDIAFTILQQLGIKTNLFKWSKNLLDTTAKQFSFYVFKDGFGFVTPSGVVTFDNISKKIIFKDAGVTDDQLNCGKAYMQLSYLDFLKR